MRKLFLCATTCIVFCISSGAQVTSDKQSPIPVFTDVNVKGQPPVKDYNYYIAKSSNQQTAAWILLGGGALCTAVGILSFPKDYNLVWGENSNKTEDNATFSTVLAVIGGAAMLSSVPFFISSSINKHRAHVNVDSKRTGFGIPGGQRDLTGLTLTIPFGG